jgi:hypothetical protein
METFNLVLAYPTSSQSLISEAQKTGGLQWEFQVKLVLTDTSMVLFFHTSARQPRKIGYEYKPHAKNDLGGKWIYKSAMDGAFPGCGHTGRALLRNPGSSISKWGASRRGNVFDPAVIFRAFQMADTAF